MAQGGRRAQILALLLAAALILGCAPPTPVTVPFATVVPSATPEPSATPSPTPEPSPTPFSIAWISDTQTLTMYPSLVPAIAPMFEWVSATRTLYNTQLLVHTGDLVENGWNQRYWDAFNGGFAALDEDMPFFPVAGNHDVAKRKRSYEPYFAQPFFARQSSEQQYRGGEGLYTRFSAGGTDFVLVGLGYITTDDDALAWARGIFDENADAVGILVVHSYLSMLEDDGVWTDPGKRLRGGIVAECPNVRLVLCGHIKGNALYIERFDDDGDGEAERQVTSMRHNYQLYRWPDCIGFLRMLTFDPNARSIRVITYSPYLDQYGLHEQDAAEEAFTVEDAF